MHYRFIDFFFVLKKNHRYISIEFASFFKIEFDGIKLRKAVSDKPKTFKCKSFSCALGPAIGSYQGVTLTSYPQMLICSVFVPDFYNLLLWKSLVFLHFQRTKDISYISTYVNCIKLGRITRNFCPAEIISNIWRVICKVMIIWWQN